MNVATGRVIVITGAMAAGKSTAAQAVAERLPRSVHLRGDGFRRMIVNGRADMTSEVDEVAVRQLRLRHRLTAATANTYAIEGFDVVVQDVLLGAELVGFLAHLEVEQRFLVVLTPSVQTLEHRDQQRNKTGYGGFSAVELDDALRTQTPAIGYWLDSSDQTAAETAEDILDHLDVARL